MKLIMENWRRFLQETANKEFLEEFQKIYEEWHDLQATYGTIHRGTYYDSEGNAYPPKEVQSVPIEDQPEYVKDAPEFYGRHSDHPATRRATFSQTQSEIDIERKLMTLFQKFADQDFFKNDVLKFHDLSYHAHVYQPTSESGLNFANFSREGYLKLGAIPGFTGRDTMSCHGSTTGKLRGQYGIILQGFTIFASRGDLGSQTLRTAHQKVKEKYSTSGLPKRPSPAKVHSPDRIEWLKKRSERLRQRNIKRGKEPKPPMTDDDAIEVINSVILNSADVSARDITGRARTSGMIEEILLDNWTIEGWYFRTTHGERLPHPEEFWRKAYEIGINQPVYEVDADGTKREIDLAIYFGEEEEIE